MTNQQLKEELANLKADYVRIQSDMDKLEYVRGRVSSAESQLIRLEEDIADINRQLEELDQQ